MVPSRRAWGNGRIIMCYENLLENLFDVVETYLESKLYDDAVEEFRAGYNYYMEKCYSERLDEVNILLAILHGLHCLSERLQSEEDKEYVSKLEELTRITFKGICYEEEVEDEE